MATHFVGTIQYVTANILKKLATYTKRRQFFFCYLMAPFQQQKKIREFCRNGYKLGKSALEI
jgi:hypothetical protein